MNWILTAEDGAILTLDNGDYYLTNIVETPSDPAAGGSGMSWGGKKERRIRDDIERTLQKAYKVAERKLNGEPFPELDDDEREYLLSLAYSPEWQPDAELLSQLSVSPELIEARRIQQEAEAMRVRLIREANMRKDEDDVIGLLL